MLSSVYNITNMRNWLQTTQLLFGALTENKMHRKSHEPDQTSPFGNYVLYSRQHLYTKVTAAQRNKNLMHVNQTDYATVNIEQNYKFAKCHCDV